MIILINKPAGPTSHDIVDKVREITGERRVGHAGTLDPFAEGFLIVLVGREATRRQAEFMKMPKTYEATFVLGKETDTGDLTGKPVKSKFSIFPPTGDLPKGDNFQFSNNFQIPNLQTINNTLQKFTGTIVQIPPQYSAVKISGKKAYEIARKGKVAKLEPKKVKVYDIKILDYRWPKLKLKMKVSSGFYVRALARDLGRALGMGAYVKKLVRTKIGQYNIKDSLPLNALKKKLNGGKLKRICQ